MHPPKNSPKNVPITYYYGKDALAKFIAFCHTQRYETFHLVCDQNTFAALGVQVERIILQQGWKIVRILLEGEDIIAHEKYIQEVLDASEDDQGIFLAVGSGTITDITRYCSHLHNSPFISLPTAPSVDGFASVVVPIVIGSFKDTAYGKAPIAIFADDDTLCRSPHPMIAAGFGDMLGKFTALPDWKLDHLLWNIPFNREIAARMRTALEACVQNVENIRDAQSQGIDSLMYGLVESGVCMVLNGNSRPASGAEHHLSHFWEMQLLKRNQPAILHGAKVGVGTVLIAKRWQHLASLTLDDVRNLLENSPLPNVEHEIKTISSFYGENAERVIKEQERFLQQSENDYCKLKEKIEKNWIQIQQLAASVPPPEQIVELLELVDGPTSVTALGLPAQDEFEALKYAHYLRNQFTVNKLGNLLGLWE